MGLTGKFWALATHMAKASAMPITECVQALSFWVKECGMNVSGLLC
jgi:hypothetical protein